MLLSEYVDQLDGATFFADNPGSTWYNVVRHYTRRSRAECASVAQGACHVRGTSTWYNVVRHYTRRNRAECASVPHTVCKAHGTMVETGLPEFEAETSLELSQVLSEMGMPRAFLQNEAEFPGMGTVAEGLNIYISRVLHKTYINVDELGTKAGASTVVEMVQRVPRV